MCRWWQHGVARCGRGLPLVKHRVAGVLGMQLSLGAPQVLVLSFRAFMSCRKLQYCLECIQEIRGALILAKAPGRCECITKETCLAPVKAVPLWAGGSTAGTPQDIGGAYWRRGGSPTKRGSSSRCSTSMALATPQPRPSCRRRCANSSRGSEVLLSLPGKDFCEPSVHQPGTL